MNTDMLRDRFKKMLSLEEGARCRYDQYITRLDDEPIKKELIRIRDDEKRHENIVKELIKYVTLFIFFICAGCSAKEKISCGEGEYLEMRREMVETQIEARGVRDKRVLEAMLSVPRHRFVPENYRHLAYTDQPLPIGEGQTISQPYIVALMTELAGLKGNEKVLEIGTGSGYQAAILARLSKEVYTIEILEPLARSSEELLKEMGYKNITVRCGDGYLGWDEHASYEAIIVTCAPPEIPQPLIEQLSEGGRMVIPVGEFYQELKVLVKQNGKVKTSSIVPVRFVPMIHP